MKPNHREPIVVSQANCLIPKVGGDSGTYQNLPVIVVR